MWLSSFKFLYFLYSRVRSDCSKLSKVVYLWNIKTADVKFYWWSY